jgi:predicted metallo-beta-lactamase superfamily hydrolase
MGGAVMDAIDLQEKAEHCRELARATGSPVVAKHLMLRAADYDQEAEAIKKAADDSAVAVSEAC